MPKRIRRKYINYNFRMHVNCACNFLNIWISYQDWLFPRHCSMNDRLHWMASEWKWWTGQMAILFTWTWTLPFCRIDQYKRAVFFFLFFFSWKLVQWKARTGLILLAFSWISEDSQLYHLLNEFCPCVHSGLDWRMSARLCWLNTASVIECGGQSSHFGR